MIGLWGCEEWIQMGQGILVKLNWADKTTIWRILSFFFHLPLYLLTQLMGCLIEDISLVNLFHD